MTANVNRFYKKLVILGVPMLNYIWSGIIIFSIFCALFTGKTEQLSNAVLSSAAEAVQLVITMSGTVCLWSGLMEIAEQSGANKAIAKLLSPILSRFFPKLDKNGGAFRAICANVTANLLGLGNAATPLGIKAMQELERETCTDKLDKKASKSMIMFVILNTASIQLIPTVIISILDSCGAENPMETVPYIWIASLCGMAAAIISVNVLCRNHSSHRK